MAVRLLVPMILLPLAEIAGFVLAVQLLGAWPTLALLAAASLAGGLLLRALGGAALRRARAVLAGDELPVAELFDGACLAVAAVLLLLPGFVTDLLALLLALPAARRWLRRRLARRVTGGAAGFAGLRTGPVRGTTIEGEFEEVQPGSGGVAAARLPGAAAPVERSPS